MELLLVLMEWKFHPQSLFGLLDARITACSYYWDNTVTGEKYINYYMEFLKEFILIKFNLILKKRYFQCNSRLINPFHVIIETSETESSAHWFRYNSLQLKTGSGKLSGVH